ncbi:MAG: cell division protein FtsB, partial [Bacteroidota bacterium]|nr:cell division protein FtsB [Bacteroidota bacterium]
MVLGACVIVFVVAFTFPAIMLLSKLLLFIVVAAVVLDIIMIYFSGRVFKASRVLPERFSNGDENPVTIYAENTYAFPIGIKIIDEL